MQVFVARKNIAKNTDLHQHTDIWKGIWWNSTTFEIPEETKNIDKSNSKGIATF